MLNSVIESMASYPAALLILVLMFMATAGLQTILRYTKPNIGYSCRNHRGCDRTFFIRNLDAVHYREPLHVIVSGAGLRYVAVHAGPWCLHKPEEIASSGRMTRVRVVFEQVPEDASFALRAVADRAEPTIEIDPNSPVQSRSFHMELPNFSILRKLRYYGMRYMIGFLGLAGVFLLSLRWNDCELYAGDLVLVGVGVLVSIISFALVVPFRGKSTIIGYLGPVDTRRYWGDRSVLSATASGRLPAIQDSRPGSTVRSALGSSRDPAAPGAE